MEIKTDVRRFADPLTAQGLKEFFSVDVVIDSCSLSHRRQCRGSQTIDKFRKGHTKVVWRLLGMAINSFTNVFRINQRRK